MIEPSAEFVNENFDLETDIGANVEAAEEHPDNIDILGMDVDKYDAFLGVTVGALAILAVGAAVYARKVAPIGARWRRIVYRNLDQ